MEKLPVKDIDKAKQIVRDAIKKLKHPHSISDPLRVSAANLNLQEIANALRSGRKIIVDIGGVSIEEKIRVSYYVAASIKHAISMDRKEKDGRKWSDAARVNKQLTVIDGSRAGSAKAYKRMMMRPLLHKRNED